MSTHNIHSQKRSINTDSISIDELVKIAELPQTPTAFAEMLSCECLVDDDGDSSFCDARNNKDDGNMPLSFPRKNMVPIGKSFPNWKRLKVSPEDFILSLEELEQNDINPSQRLDRMGSIEKVDRKNTSFSFELGQEFEVGAKTLPPCTKRRYYQEAKKSIDEVVHILREYPPASASSPIVYNVLDWETIVVNSSPDMVIIYFRRDFQDADPFKVALKLWEYGNCEEWMKEIDLQIQRVSTLEKICYNALVLEIEEKNKFPPYEECFLRCRSKLGEFSTVIASRTINKNGGSSSHRNILQGFIVCPLVVPCSVNNEQLGARIEIIYCYPRSENSAGISVASFLSTIPRWEAILKRP